MADILGGLFAAPQMSPETRNLMIAAGTAMANKGQGFGQTMSTLSGQAQQQEMQRRQSNMTASWLQAQGAAPELVDMAAQGMGAQALSMWQMTKPKATATPASVQEYEYAKGQGYQGSYEDWKNSPTQRQNTEYGLNPIFATDPQGNTVLYQPSKTGGVKQMEFPDGVTPLGQYDKAFETSRGSTVGKSQAEAQQQLPAASAAANEVIRLTDAVINDPALPQAVGPVQGRLPSFMPDTVAFEARVNQLKNKAFLTARQELKGGGAITDFEGQKAESALNRAQYATSEEEFVKAMQEFKDAVVRGYQILQAQATGQNPFPTPQMGGATQAAPQQPSNNDPLGIR